MPKLDNVTVLQESTKTPYLSIGIIIRNGGDLFEECLESIRARLQPDTELVIVDTCSNDGGKTIELAKKYGDTVAVYTGPDGSWSPEMAWFTDAGAARNVTMALSKGRWYGWVDGDDLWAPPEEAEKLLRANGRWK